MVLLFIDSSQYHVRTLTVGAMRIGEIGCHIDLVRLDLGNQFLNNADVTLRDGQLLNLSTLVERQVEEMDMILVDVVIATGSGS